MCVFPRLCRRVLSPKWSPLHSFVCLMAFSMVGCVLEFIAERARVRAGLFESPPLCNDPFPIYMFKAWFLSPDSVSSVP
jgi:hypothetical protein